MSKCSCLKPVAVAGVLLGSSLIPAFGAGAPDIETVPDFMAPGTGWTMINSNATDYVDPISGAKPVTNDPKYPHIGNLQPGQKTERVADLTNPILQDWVKPQMQKYNEEVIGGTIPFVATSLCWPGGVPAQHPGDACSQRARGDPVLGVGAVSEIGQLLRCAIGVAAAVLLRARLAGYLQIAV